MRIAMFTDNFYPEISGISDSIIDSAKELAKLGHQIDLYVPKYSASDFQTYNVAAKELDLGEQVKIHRFLSCRYPTPTKQGRFVLPNGLRWLAMCRNRPDIIHVHDCFGVGIEGVLAAKFLGVPLSGTNHTPITEFIRYGPVHSGLVSKIALKFVSWFYNRCDFVSAPCGAIFAEMKEHGFKKPMRVISNPVDLKNYCPPSSAAEKEQIKKEFGLSAFVVLYTGRLAMEKHVDILIRAVANAREKIADINLAITGHGKEELLLKSLVQELQMAKCIKFFGTLSAAKHARIYQAADVFAIASTAEMQSLSLMKAMATGLPTIGVNAWALPEYISEKNGYVLEPGDYRGIAEKLVFLRFNEAKREQLGRGGLATVQNFSPARIAQEWVEIYEKMGPKKYPAFAQSLKLSIVIPAYNEEKYLGDCLESILRQAQAEKYEPEIIVVNNASTDRTRQVAAAFPGIKIVDESAKGLVNARRAGYLASHGDLIANVDADTRLPAGWLKKVLAEFAADPKLAALSGPYIYYDLNWWNRILVRIWYYGGFLMHLFNHFILRKGAVLQGGNFIVRRRHFTMIGGFNTEFDFYGEDTDVARRIQKVGRVKFTFQLPMLTSGRRLNKEGLIVAGSRYAINHVWTLIFKKPFTKKSSDIRE